MTTSVSDRRALAIGLWSASTAAVVIATAILIATRDADVPASWGFRGASGLFAVTCSTVGAIVALRRPENLCGWLFVAIGALFATAALVNEYVIAGALVVPGGLPATTALAWLLAWLWVPPLGIALIMLPLYFPTGVLVSPSWRVATVFGIAAIAGFSVAAAFAPGPIQQATFLDNPFGIPGMDTASYGPVFGVAAIAMSIAIVLALVSLARRYRGTDDDARRQIRWFALAALVAGTIDVLYLIVSGISATGSKGMEILVIVSMLGLPIAAGLAILRYRLFDIDRIISRTISYGLVTALLVTLFLVVNLAMQGLVSSVTSTNSVTIAASTLLVAALFTPIRRRVQRLVDRRFDRARYDGDRMASAFSTRMRDAIELPTVTADLDRTVRAATAPSSLALWLREPGR